MLIKIHGMSEGEIERALSEADACLHEINVSDLTPAQIFKIAFILGREFTLDSYGALDDGLGAYKLFERVIGK